MEAKTDRRIKRTRYLLVHALTSLMLKKSIKDITVKELCESVDINRGTFYLHYKDIYDMLEQTEQELLEQFEQVFKNYHPDHTPDFPYPLFVEIFQIIDQNSNLCCALLSPNGDISFSVKIKKLFEHQYIHEWMVAHHSADFLPTYEYFSSFLVSGCSGLIESWLAHEKKETPEEMARLISKLISTGMTSVYPIPCGQPDDL